MAVFSSLAVILICSNSLIKLSILALKFVKAEVIFLCQFLKSTRVRKKYFIKHKKNVTNSRLEKCLLTQIEGCWEESDWHPNIGCKTISALNGWNRAFQILRHFVC